MSGLYCIKSNDPGRFYQLLIIKYENIRLLAVKMVDSHTMDEIIALTRGVFRLRELWLRETRIAGGMWQAAQVRREIVTGGGRVICTLNGDGGLMPGIHPRRRFRADAGSPEITHAGDASIRLERLDAHRDRMLAQAALPGLSSDVDRIR